MSFPLFTSIKPPADAAELSYLRDCVNSWHAAGFDPVAVNGPHEMEVLRQSDLGIQFAPVMKDGRPRIGAFLSAIRESDERFAGIINADCRIIGYPGLAAGIKDALDQRCILAWRVDVGEDIKPAAANHGFDAYFLDTRFLPTDDVGFSIGDPWWDYWFPLACEIRGATLETLRVPLLTHKVHPVNWQRRNWEAGASRFWQVLRNSKPAHPLPCSLFAKIPSAWWSKPRLNAAQIASLSLITPAWFYDERPQGRPIMPPDMALVETMLTFGGTALLDAADLTVMQNRLRLIIRPMRIAVSIFRRMRERIL